MSALPAGSLVQCPGCRTQFQPRAVSDNYTRCPQCGRFLDVTNNAAVQQSPAADGGYGLAPAEVAAPPVASQAMGIGACPLCAHELPSGAVLCIQCGYDLRTGRKIKQRNEAGQPVRETSATTAVAEGNKRRCPVCGSPLLARETRCSKCNTRTPVGEQQKRPGEELSDETGVKLIKIDQALRERSAWFAGRTLVPVREGTVQRLLGCGCDVGAIVAGWVLLLTKPLIVLFSIASFAYLIPSGFLIAIVGCMICGVVLFAATFLCGFFLGFPFGLLLGLFGYEDVGWGG